MRYLIRAIGLFAVGAVLGLAGNALAQTVAGSPHDLSTGSLNLPTGVTSSTGEVCVFCHTPHSARPASELEAPLWNKLDGTAPASFTLYDSATMDAGTPLTVGSVSAACLTCHDGTQGVDVVINAPGTGGIDAVSGTALFAGGTPPITVDQMGAGFADLGSDLSNDHPIGILYAAGVDATGNPVGDLDFVAATTDTINGKVRWWVDESTGTPAVREKTDMILFTRSDGTPDEPYVECASCHDPHAGDAADNGVANAEGSAVSFMRVANTGSAVCVACHVK